MSVVNSASDVRPSLVWSVTFVKRSAVGGPPPQVRHHVLAADAEVDDEVLQRLDLHDDQIPAAGGAERRPARARETRAAAGEPRARVLPPAPRRSAAGTEPRRRA